MKNEPLKDKKEVVFVLHPIQEKLIKKLCFGKCGKISVGCIKDEELGAMFPCTEENCKYEEKRIELGKLDTGEIVYLRKLKEKNEKE